MLLNAALVMGGLGFAAAVSLSIACKLFYVPEDPRLKDLLKALPGINCGACGYIGCEGAARALLAGKARVNVCVSGGPDVIAALARVMGISHSGKDAGVAVINCTGGLRAETRFIYTGARDCRAETLFGGGSKVCSNACFGHGSCVRACPFGAITLGPEQLPIVNGELCRGCGRCVEVCPNGVIAIEGLTTRLLGLNQTDQCLAPCQQKCPAQIDIPLFLRNLQAKRLKTALAIIKDRNPFPLTCGRVCPHTCENICRRNIADEGVAINLLERFLGEQERAFGRRLTVDRAADTGFKIAVVGSGPAGLACAYFLRRLGHHPTIFEAQAEPGGMLRYGIPEYRLPQSVVDWEVNGILELGIPVRTQVRLGHDFDLEYLGRNGFHAIFLGIGAWRVPHLCVPGEYAKNVMSSLHFLSGIGSEISSLSGQRAVVIGESNTAMDCARSCVRLGARAITVVCPSIQEDMSARKRDVKRAMEEGVDIIFATIPDRIDANEEGQVQALLYHPMKVDSTAKAGSQILETMEDGRSRIECDLVIAAYERKPDLTWLEDVSGGRANFKTTKTELLAVERDTMLASVPNIFAAGDLSTGRATVISAVAGGRRAARSIHFSLTRGDIPISSLVQHRINPKSILKDIKVEQPTLRIEARELPVEVRRHSFTEEVVATISPEDAIAEAERCLHCGTLCYDKR